jgi:LEA14-like dessication related protein
MNQKTKYILAGVVGLVAIAGTFFYIQYRKLMDYTIKPKSVRITKLSLSKIAMDVYLNFTNKSTLNFDIIEQDYKVYINDKFVSRVQNYSSNSVKAKSTSLIGVNVEFNPSKVLKVIGKNLSDLLFKQDTVIIKIEMKLKVSLYGIKISIPYVMKDTLKNLTAKEEKS